MVKGSKTALVTGGGGFIGRATCEALKAAGWTVLEAGRKKTALGSYPIVLDLSNPATFNALDTAPHFDTLIHLGARVALAGEPESDLYVTNVLSTGYIAYLAKRRNAHLIFASSIAVHGLGASLIEAETPIDPDTSYARSKWLAEQLIRAAAPESCILRIGGVYGYQGPGHLGLNRAIAGALRGEAPQLVGKGIARRSYIYVKDLGQKIADAADRNLSGTHLSPGEETLSFGAMLRTTCDVLAPEISPVMIPGDEAVDQIVAPSSVLKKGRSFREALLDIQSDAARENAS